MPTLTGLTREQISDQTEIALATVCGRVCPMIEREILVLKSDLAGEPEHRLDHHLETVAAECKQ
jgi:hypothetical protein